MKKNVEKTIEKIVKQRIQNDSEELRREYVRLMKIAEKLYKEEK